MPVSPTGAAARASESAHQKSRQGETTCPRQSLSPPSGDVFVAGTNITKLSDNELTKLRRRHIGFIFQFFNLLPMLTAEENVLLPLSIAGEKPDREWVEELTARAGLRGRERHRPAELSGG